MRFSFKQLQYFVATGEAGSIRAAATTVGVSEPSISTAIAHLETELNVQLFVRHHAQGVSLTPSGQRLLADSKDVLDRAHALYDVADELSDSLSGQVSVGSLVTLAALVVPTLVQSFTRQHPSVRIATTENNQNGLIDALKRAEIDIAITYDMQIPNDIVFAPLAELPAHVIVAADHPLAQSPTISLKDLADEPFILLDLPTSREYFFGLFRQAGVTPMIATRSQHQDVVWAMVANGAGYSLRNVRPKTESALDGQRIVSIPLREAGTPLHLGIATLANVRKRRVVETFEHYCRDRISGSQIPGMTDLRSTT